jgi:hypothetical protein
MAGQKINGIPRRLYAQIILVGMIAGAAIGVVAALLGAHH